MEPVISTVLQALEVGAQAAATGIATDEIKRIYDKLKTLIQQKWVGKPTAEKLLTAYEKNPKSNEEMLAEKLEESGIHRDQNIYRQAERLIQEVKIANSTIAVDSSRQEVLNLDRDNSPGSTHTATHGGIIDNSIRRADSGGIFNEGQFHQVNNVNNRQTRLAVLIGLLALALVGIVFYLIRTGKIQLPRAVSLPNLLEPTPSNQNTAVEDVEINVKLNLTETPVLEGTVTNTGKSEIEEFYVKVTVFNFSKQIIYNGSSYSDFPYSDPPDLDLRGIKLIYYFNNTKNLKSGETRPVIWHLNLDNAMLDGLPERFNGEKFSFRVLWGVRYEWQVQAVDKDAFLQDQARLSKQ